MMQAGTHSDLDHSAPRPARTGRRRAGLRLVAVFGAAAVLSGGAVACSGEPGPDAALAAFARAWHDGTVGTLTFATDGGGTMKGTTVADQLTSLSGDLAARRPTLRATGEPATGTSPVQAPAEVSWPVADGVTWTYRTTVPLRKLDQGWAVLWSPAVVHPDLRPGDHLAVATQAAPRAQILDGSGSPVVSNKPVVTIQVHPADITDMAVTVRILGDALASVGVDLAGKELEGQINAAGPDAHVDLVTLRREAYDKIRSLIHELPGLAFREGNLPLAPTATWGRGVLGRVGEVQKDRMDANRGAYRVGDLVGYGGLQEKFDQRLRGTPAVTVSARTEDGDDQEARELFRSDPKPGEPVKTTLDTRTQQAAEQALSTQPKASALVAIRISDGAVLAVANSGPDSGASNVAFTGAVPPGSTFKMVSAYALLGNGSITPETVIDCPRNLTVDGMSFHNSDNFALGKVPMHTNFARSCNTAFASLAPKLGDDGLARSAAELGIGTRWNLGLDTFTGKVATGGPAAERAAAVFGQGRTQVSPVALAAAAAAVARGQWKQPSLLADPSPGTPAGPGPHLKAEVLNALKPMMREVVTNGTATGVRNVAGPPIYGKTGTAEYDNNPAHSHSWFVGFLGDIAFACFVQDGGNTGDAVPMVGRFFGQLR